MTEWLLVMSQSYVAKRDKEQTPKMLKCIKLFRMFDQAELGFWRNEHLQTFEALHLMHLKTQSTQQDAPEKEQKSKQKLTRRYYPQCSMI